MTLIVEAKGADFVNRGGELMLMAALARLHRMNIEFTLVIEPRANANFRAIQSIGAALKLPFRFKGLDISSLSYLIPRSLRRYLQSHYGIYLEADIDVILDMSGFAYGDQWPARSLRNLCREIQRFRKKGKKVILLPQALGPFDNTSPQNLARKSLPLANLVFPRDKISFEHLTKLCGASESFVCCPDFTAEVVMVDEQPITRQEADKTGTFLLIPNFNMLSQTAEGSFSQAGYKELFSTLAVLGKEAGYTPILLNHEGNRDAELCRQIQALIPFEIEMIAPESGMAIKKIIASSSMVLSSRYHACVSALSQGVPCLGTSWSHKYETLYSEYGVPQWLLRQNTPATELSRLLEQCGTPDQLVKLRQHSAQVNQKIDDMWNRVELELTDQITSDQLN